LSAAGRIHGIKVISCQVFWSRQTTVGDAIIPRMAAGRIGKRRWELSQDVRRTWRLLEALDPKLPEDVAIAGVYENSGL